MLWDNIFNIIQNETKYFIYISFSNKTNIKYYDNPQYGLSKSQSFVVYSMLKISDVTDSGRQ